MSRLSASVIFSKAVTDTEPPIVNSIEWEAVHAHTLFGKRSHRSDGTRAQTGHDPHNARGQGAILHLGILKTGGSNK